VIAAAAAAATAGCQQKETDGVRERERRQPSLFKAPFKCLKHERQ